MSKFFLLYLAPVSAIDQMMANSNPEQMKAGMDAWMAWGKKAATSIVDMGGPLGKTKRITPAGIEDVSNNIGAYMVVRAASHEAAAKLFENHPHFTKFPGEAVEVMPVLPIPGQ